MISLRERLATILSLATQLRELDQLHERVRKAELVRRSRGLRQKKNAPLAKRPAAPLSHATLAAPREPRRPG